MLPLLDTNGTNSGQKLDKNWTQTGQTLDNKATLTSMESILNLSERLATALLS